MADAANLDKKDWAIIAVLKENAKLSTQQIAKRTRIPITTVHNRIKKMEKAGIIRGYTVVLDNKKVGKPIAAFILVTVDYKLLKELKICIFHQCFTGGIACTFISSSGKCRV